MYEDFFASFVAWTLVLALVGGLFSENAAIVIIVAALGIAFALTVCVIGACLEGMRLLLIKLGMMKDNHPYRRGY